MGKKYLNDFSVGDKISAFAILRKIDIREYNGKPYLLLEFGDKHGRIKGILWENSKEIASLFKQGDIVKVFGTIATYRDDLQIRVEGIRASQDGEYDKNDFIQGPKEDIHALAEKFDKLINSVKDSNLSKLLNILVSPDGKHREKFVMAPGGKLWHHNYNGGLLEHTVSVANICDFLATQYTNTNRDLLITGALLHDLGKVIEYDYETNVIDFSDQGRLKGHIVMGYEIVNKTINSIENFPEELSFLLGHMILSHQGKQEYGSPVVPKTIESLLLYYADEMDSKTVAFTRIITETKRTGKKWSNFVPLMERYLYAGDTN